MQRTGLRPLALAVLLSGAVPALAQRGCEGVAAPALTRRLLTAVCADPAHPLVSLFERHGPPSHALGGVRRGLAVVFERGADSILVWLDADGDLAGLVSGTDLGTLAPDRAVIWSDEGGRAVFIVPQVDGSQRQVDSATGRVEERPPSVTNRALAAASEATRTGDHAAAAQALRSAVDADPTDPEAWRALSRALERSGDDAAARAALARGMQTLHGARLTPVSTEWRVVDPRARVALELVAQRERAGEHAAALQALEEALRLYPCMDEAVLRHAAEVRRSRGVDAADEELRRAIARLACPRAQASAHIDAARFHERERAYLYTRAHLYAALALGEDREATLRSLADVEVALVNPCEARAVLQRLHARWVADFDAATDIRRREYAAARLVRLEHELAQLELR